uniref:C-type lectin domain-containing protein n=1 Tax=Mola mola TaxID=94237 RepID=A0A3Q3X5W0_MOLML
MKLCLLLWTSYARFTNRGKSVMTETIIPSRALGAKSPSGDHQEGLRRGGCPMSWYSLNGCSELLCVSEGANLVSIHSQGQQGTHLCWTWVGLSDVLKEGSWMWSVGSAYDFDYRAAQEPNSVEGNKHCVDEMVLKGITSLRIDECSCIIPISTASRKKLSTVMNQPG